MSEVKVNKITPTAACGTVTLGDSGDTFTIPSGVTLSSAGSITNSGTITNTGTISGGTITGTIDNQVNWDTTAKTAGFTAVAGNGYFVNTTSGAITVTLPATPTAGDLVGIKDYANTADINAITIARNGENIQGTANDFVISTEGLAITLIYVDATQGWVSTGAAQANDIVGPLFVTATGGTITTCGDYKYHKFTSPGTFCVSCAGNPGGSSTVQVLVVAGGGGGSNNGSGGGGAGGLRNISCTPVTATGYPVTIGAGGSTGPACSVPSTTDGSPSSAISITSTGGGRSGLASGSPPQPYHSGNPGGSGGGAAGNGRPGNGGTGNTPPVSPSQGNNGGPENTSPASRAGGAGGGGAGAAGTQVGPGDSASCGALQNGGPGGIGVDVSPSFPAPLGGSPAGYYAGGGGGAANNDLSSCRTGGTGGLGGGGNGGGTPSAATAGTANTGGGGASTPTTGPNTSPTGTTGGSGIVIIKYKYQ